MMSFNSKILLFGEYAIIKGSKGLAVPFERFQGSFTKAESHSKVTPKLRLNEFCEYLKGSSLLSEQLDLISFSKDIQDGLFFESNIPEGYGVGSSGALCAAVYAKYSGGFKRKDFYSNSELKRLKDMMALMESFYHGSSSGLDCLISLIDKPLLIESRSQFNLIPAPNLSKFGQFYLYDSGKSRTTSAFVHEFLSRYENEAKYKKEIDIFALLTDKIINEFSEQNAKAFNDSFYELSKIQLSLFKSMIPAHIKELWAHGIETRKFSFKLCGAGGGGFFLVYSNDSEFNQNCEYLKLS